MPKDDLLDQTKDFGVVIPSTEPDKLYTMIDGKKVEVVKNPEMKETPESTIHYHNDLDQPGIDITSGLSGVNITSPTNNDLLAYDTPSGQWINQTAIGAAVVPEGGTTTSLTLVQPTIGTMSATGGTATSLTLVTPTIGTPVLTGGTLTNSILVTPTIGTPTLTGGTLTNSVLVTPTIGTMTATGGTVTNLTAVTPTIADFTNATHTHISLAQGGTVDHTSLSSIGTNTHVQIDTHIAASGTVVHGLGNMSLQNNGSVSISGGTLTNISLVTPTIGTPAITGGTVTNGVLVTPTIGTPSLTGGTLNPVAYQAGGTLGVNGTAVYVKTVDFVGQTVTNGTIIFTQGIATSVS